jgi:SAM-dependent methyltransferase
MVGAAMPEYMLRQAGAEQSERSRLKLLEQACDPYTAGQFDAIGVGEGWRCLDVGAGGGSATRLLAERVGELGSVLSVDLDTRLLEPLASDRVEVRRHDLLADPLPEASFDLVHARNLLMHLPGRQHALRRLLAAVRPGGWLAVLEPDFNVVTFSPSSAVSERAWSAFCDAAVEGGWDPGYGARLPADVNALEMAELHVDVVVSDSPGGGLRARLFADTLERFRDRMLAPGLDARVDRRGRASGARRRALASRALRQGTELIERLADELREAVSIRPGDPTFEGDSEDGDRDLGRQGGGRVFDSALAQRLGERRRDRCELHDLAFAQLGGCRDDLLTLASERPALL